MQNQLQNDYPNYVAQLPGENLAWMQALRQQAFAQFMQQGIPTLRNEDWKYTNLHRLNNQEFILISEANQQAINPELPVFSDNARLVFVDGIFNPALSTQLNEKVVISTLRAALQNQSQLLQNHLQKSITTTTSAFPALNTSMAFDGAVIEIPENVDAGIIEIVYYTTAQSPTELTAALIQPRTLILCGDHSQATIVEHFNGDKEAFSLTNSVTEIELGKQSKIEHIKLQAEAAKTDHLGQLFVAQQQDSHFKNILLSYGANIARNEIHATFVGKHATTELYGLFLAQHKQHMDQYTLIDHAASHCTSEQLYRGILLDSARGVFNGRVIVQPHAQKTSAKQKNNNLLLSPLAEIDTKPELQIYNDDVQCSHGATVGQLDPQALLYLRARGLPLEEAKNLLLNAFAEEIFEKISNEELRSLIRDFLNES